MNTEQIIRDLANDAKPVRRLAPVGLRWFLWVLVVTANACAALAITGTLPRLFQSTHTTCYWIQSGLLAATVLLSGWATLSLGIPGRARHPWHRWTPVATFMAWLIVIMVTGVLSGPGHCGISPGCIGSIVLTGAVPGMVLYLMCRRAAPLRSNWTGVLLMGAAAATGALGTHFKCENQDVLHVLSWHVMPVIALAAAGLLVGRWLVRWMQRTPSNTSAANRF